MNELTLQDLTPSQMAVRFAKLSQAKKQIDGELADIRERLLVEMQNSRALTIKTEEYTITRAKRVTPEVFNLEDLRKWFGQKNLPFSTKEIPEDYVVATVRDSVRKGDIPAGVEAKETEYVSVRTPKE